MSRGKLSFFIVFFLTFSFVTNARWIDKHPITVTQPDGEVINCFTTGDEYYNWVHDADGYTLVRDSLTGYVVYAELQNDKLVSSGQRVGRNHSRPERLQPWINISTQKRERLRNDFLNAIPKRIIKRDVDISNASENTGKNNGKLNNLVIYIRFADETEFAVTKIDLFKKMFNDDSAPDAKSMYNYFKAVSYGKMLIQSTFYPTSPGNVILSYQDNQPRSYYQPYNATTNRNGYQDDGIELISREHELLRRAIQYVSSQIPSNLNLDFDNDGYVDNICFIVKGNTTAWSTLLWPHKWCLYSNTTNINGKRVWVYNFQIEEDLSKYGASVLAHEMFHTLGAPDLYRYTDKTITPVGLWDLMANDVLQSSTAWIKYKYGGWIDNIPEITNSGTYTLHNVMSSIGTVAFKIASPTSTKGEFFIVEYRDKNVFPESNIPGSGLIIYRVNEEEALGNANGPPDEVYIYRPGGTNSVNGTINSANFSSQAGRITFSAPSFGFLTNNTNGLGGIYIEEISASGGTTMTFKVVMPGAKTVTIGAQSGTLTQGTTGSATYAITTTNITNTLTGTVTWYTSSKGTTTTTAPTGVTSSVSTGSASRTLTVNTTAASPAGTYYIAVTIDGVRSSVTTFTIGKGNNASLSALTVNQGTLSPVFTASTTAYTVNVANSVSSITVSATKADVNATVTGAGEKQLNVGENIISVVVTAQDGATKKTYTITVNRAPVPNANLSALTVDKGTLFPAFDVNITNYSLTVDKTVTGINIIGIAVDTAADISGSGYHSIDANYKQINIVVKSSDRSTTKTYSIVVIKELPTGEEDIKAVPLTAYPNPACDFVTIGGLQENGKLSVFDAVGQVRIQHNITSTQETISLSALPKGIYIVQVVEGDKKRTIKIIVE